METLAISRTHVQGTVIFVSAIFRLELTSNTWRAAVDSTQVAIFADNRDVSTFTIQTAVIRTDASVITIFNRGARRAGVAWATRNAGIETTRLRIALVEGTVDIIAAVYRLIDTAGLRIARIQRTHTTVVTIDQYVRAQSILKRIASIRCTSIAVTAIFRRIDATHRRIARIYSAVIVDTWTALNRISTMR